MAQCTTCSKTLQGSWNMTDAGPTYARTGRYLGIGDGYFLYSGSPNWVYCYCNTCWQAQVLQLSFVQNLKQENTNLKQQLTPLQEQHTTLQAELTKLKEELTTCKQQMNVVADQLSKFKDFTSIDQLRNLLKQLSTTQVEMLHQQTKFRIDQFEDLHTEQQKQCSQRFVSSTSAQLKASIDQILVLQTDVLNRRRKAKETVYQTLKDADVNKSTMDQSVKPLEDEIIEIESEITNWQTFVTNMNACSTG